MWWWRLLLIIIADAPFSQRTPPVHVVTFNFNNTMWAILGLSTWQKEARVSRKNFIHQESIHEQPNSLNSRQNDQQCHFYFLFLSSLSFQSARTYWAEENSCHHVSCNLLPIPPCLLSPLQSQTLHISCRLQVLVILTIKYNHLLHVASSRDLYYHYNNTTCLSSESVGRNRIVTATK